MVRYIQGSGNFLVVKWRANESLKSALKREINEELNISIYEKDMAIFESYTFNRGKIALNLHFFFVRHG